MRRGVGHRDSSVTNEQIAGILERVAAHLETQHASIYRIDAYRAAAEVVRRQGESVQDLAQRSGRAGLDALPQIGSSLSAAIEEIADTGGLRLLDRLEGRVSPVELFTTVPGLGVALAERIHHGLQIDTLEELEVAAHDGRLASLSGFGPRRLEAIGAVLATRLARSARTRARRGAALQAAGVRVEVPNASRPTVELLLAIDTEYRDRAERGELPRIAPRRNNPQREAWLPVLHTERDGWHFTAMFSNTDRAHELDRTRDWAIVYYERNGHEDQCTVVTEYRGPHAGQRVVRGRESERPA